MIGQLIKYTELALGQKLQELKQQGLKQQLGEELIQEPFTVEPLAKGTELEEQELNFRQEG